MIVKDLIEQLSKLNPDLPVHIAYDYGDHCHSTVAPEIEHVIETEVGYSEYHKMDQVLDEDEEDLGDASERPSHPAIVLSPCEV